MNDEEHQARIYYHQTFIIGRIIEIQDIKAIVNKRELQEEIKTTAPILQASPNTSWTPRECKYLRRFLRAVNRA